MNYNSDILVIAIIIYAIAVIVGLGLAAFFIRNDIRHKKKNEEKVTCSGCVYLAYNNDGSTYCEQRLEGSLPHFNKHNIRPCKKVKIGENNAR